LSQRPKIALKGLSLPQGKTLFTFEDFSDGALVVQTGRFQAGNNQMVAEIDETGEYKFPYTLGNNKIMAAFFAGVEIEKIYPGVSSKDGSLSVKSLLNGKIPRKEDMSFEGDGLIRSYSYSVGEAETFRITTNSYTTPKGWHRIPLNISILNLGQNGQIHLSEEFNLVNFKFGDHVDVSDLETMGPRGISIRDNRLKSKVPIDYKNVSGPKSLDELQQQRDAMFKLRVPKSEEEFQAKSDMRFEDQREVKHSNNRGLYFALSGVLMIIGVVILFLRRARK
jgi:hypothetical protein